MQKQALWKRLKRKKGYLPADDILHHFDITRPPIRIEELAEQLGAEVVGITGTEWHGKIEPLGNGFARIFVKRDTSKVHQRFTVAHEIGHLILHDGEHLRTYGNGRNGAHRDFDFLAKGDFEAQANGYAAKLLMPGWMVRVIGQEIGSYAPSKLAPHFEVSAVAMNYRLKKMGIIE